MLVEKVDCTTGIDVGWDKSFVVANANILLPHQLVWLKLPIVIPIGLRGYSKPDVQFKCGWRTICNFQTGILVGLKNSMWLLDGYAFESGHYLYIIKQKHHQKVTWSSNGINWWLIVIDVSLFIVITLKFYQLSLLADNMQPISASTHENRAHCMRWFHLFRYSFFQQKITC